MEIIDKIVNFQLCEKCEHWDLDEAKDPCNECLDSPVNTNSRVPLYFKEKTSDTTAK